MSESSAAHKGPRHTGDPSADRKGPPRIGDPSPDQESGGPIDAVLQEIRQAIAAAADPTAAMTRTIEILKARQPLYTWVGIYLLDDDTLVLGPYLGKPSPHTRIPLGRGICGAAATARTTIIVDDVQSDPRYLACSIETQSEIVVPIMRGGEVLGELDIDSDRLAAFDQRDRELLEAVAAALSETL